MILILSGFDLVSIVINHPVQIISTLLWSMDMFDRRINDTWMNTSLIFGSFLVFTLLTLTLERLLSIMFPIFHRKSVTRKRLMFLLTFLIIIGVVFKIFYNLAANVMADILVTVVLLSILFAFAFLNYKIFLIAKLKREDGRVTSKSIGTPTHGERKEHKKNIKSISTCSLAVACFFFICFCPEIVNGVWRLTTKAPWYDREAVLIRVWCNTLIVLKSTFNCIIFFWRNSILRREGMKVAKCLWN